MITLDELTKRKAELIAQQSNLQAQLYGYEGAIKDCEYWIEKLNSQEVADNGCGGNTD